MQCVRNWLQRVTVNYVTSVTKGFILGPVLFSVSINGLDKGLEGVLSLFADTKLEGASESIMSGGALQRNQDKSETHQPRSLTVANARL